jgi:hypothetical protein
MADPIAATVKPRSLMAGHFRHPRAMQSISTSNGPCQGKTQIKLRAGGSCGKYRA